MARGVHLHMPLVGGGGMGGNNSIALNTTDLTPDTRVTRTALSVQIKINLPRSTRYIITIYDKLHILQAKYRDPTEFLNLAAKVSYVPLK